MAEASNFTSECDAESLKRLLNETASACQKCLVAVDSVATSQQQASLSTPHSTISGLTSVEVEAMEKLRRRCMELEYQLAAERSRKEDHLTDIQQRQIDDIIVKYKQQIKSIEDEKMALEDENRRLRLVNDQRESTNASLTHHVESLTSEVEQLRLAMATGSHDDHVQFLTEQARQFHADFESEKRDRIAAEAQVSKLRQQLAAANTQVYQSSVQQMQDIARRRQASLDYYREQYDSAHPRGPSPPPPPGHRYADGEDEIDSAAVVQNRDYDEVDSVENCLMQTDIARHSDDHV